MAAWMLPAAIGGAALLGYKGAQDTNAASAQAAQAQIDFQREMSNTAFQRQVEDLKSAGINPMMATHLGGSSTPQGAMPMFVNPGAAAASAGGAFGSALSSAAQAEKTGIESDILGKTGLAQARANLEKTVADIGLTAQQTAKVVKDTELVAEQIVTEREKPAQIRAMAANLEAMTQTEAFKQLNYGQQTRLLSAQTSYYMSRAQLEANQVAAEFKANNIGREFEQVSPALGFVGRAIEKGINVGRTLLRAIGK
jgi:hypothetical protein